MIEVEKIIKDLCPNGVPYKTMAELGEFYGGLTGKSKEDFKDGNAKFITYVNVFNNISLKLDVEEKVKITEGERQNTIEYGDVIFTGSSETPNECGMSSVLTVKTDEKLYLNSFCFGFRLFDKELLLPDFMKYLFRSAEMRKAITKTASGVTRFNVSKSKMAKIQVPLPPLVAQREIVRVLDKFTLLSQELAAELAARKAQYEFYRDKLLTFDDIAGGGVQLK
ncbi:MAG: restriction endonuclease subunit S [Clostridia bacterium]|nr:restriction endonuclease subunit S [Clostridia bacterium]